MKKLCCDENLDVCQALKVRLEAGGIGCVVKHAGADALLGGDKPLIGSPLPELWITDDTQFDRAWQLAYGDSGSSGPPSDAETDESSDT
jgi:hypothetical protein